MDEPPSRMLVFIDECMPADWFRETFESRGHEVRGVGEGFPSASPDPSILAAADSYGAVVVSTDKDWRLLVQRVAAGERGQFQRAGRILFNCSHVVAMARLHELIEDIEREYTVAQRTGRQLIMRITGGNFRVER